MPIYVYEAVDAQKGCDSCRGSFELFQSFSEAALAKCPACGADVRRVIQPVGFAMGKKHLLSDSNIKKHGFTKLVNEGEGKFRKI